MKKTNILTILSSLVIALALIGVLGYQIPAVKSRVVWRAEVARAYLRGLIYPARAVPTPLSRSDQSTPLPSPTPTQTMTPTANSPESTQPPTATPTITPTPTPIPAAASLSSTYWEKQTANNCGPASLAIYLRYFGWEGDQEDISALIKPLIADRNVNVEELVYFVRSHAGWLNAEFRVGGTVERLKELVAAGFPVLIEESFKFEEPYWPNDDLWAAHYLLVTGYDDNAQVFIGQDSYHGPDQKLAYQTLDADWKIFNRVYIIVYRPEQEGALKAILRDDWDVDVNRQSALETAQADTLANPEDAFAWFNLGTNLVYFERYGEAATAYDNARNLGLPQRMLRYQFGPFFAYFHSGLNEELLALTEFALQRTDNSEEALLWHGWGLYRDGDLQGAIEDWRAALEANPFYQDARYALDFVGSSP